MNILQNMEYNRIFSSLAIGATLISPLSANDFNQSLQLSYKAPYDKYTDYTTTKQSTFDDSLLKNDVEMMKTIEMSYLINLVEQKYNTKVVNTWLPADGNLEKLCLFISLENQGELKSKYDDLELDIFLTLEDTIKQSQFFNMIAIM